MLVTMKNGETVNIRNEWDMQYYMKELMGEEVVEAYNKIQDELLEEKRDDIEYEVYLKLEEMEEELDEVVEYLKDTKRVHRKTILNHIYNLYDRIKNLK